MKNIQEGGRSAIIPQEPLQSLKNHMQDLRKEKWGSVRKY